MDKFKPVFKTLSLVFGLCLTMAVATPLARAGTLDSMNSLSPAPASQTQTPGQTILIPDPPALDAASYVIMDADSMHIIASKNADQRLPPASLTKLMTLYVVSNALKNGQIHLDDKVRISKKAWQTGGSRMFVKVDSLVTVQDLLKGVIVDSGNDACVALAEYVAGTEDAFVSLMNQQAEKLGLKNSHFTDCNGLPHPDHYASAQDFAILAHHLIYDFPQYYAWYSEKTFEYNGITQNNRNRLLWLYPSADGLKTGHTDSAGYCLVGSAKKDGMRLITVVMGAPTDNARAQDSVSLLTYGFRFYKTYRLYTPGETLSQVRVWKGENKHVPIGVNDTVYLTLPLGQYEKLQATTVLTSPLNAPVTKGMVLGHLTLSLENKPLAQYPLVALEDDPKGNVWNQFLDTMSMKISGMFHKKTSS